MSHTHDEKTVKKLSDRLSRAVGHLESVKKMLQNGDDCSQVLIQLAAVRSAINAAGKELLKHHLNHCLVEAVQHHDDVILDEMNSAIDKFIK